MLIAPPTSSAFAQVAAPSNAALWHGLALGMSPEEAALLIGTVDGVRSVKVRGGSKERAERLQIRYTDQKVSIAGLSFEISPQFEHNRLKEVWLASSNQCGSQAVQSYEALAAGLSSKYPDRVVRGEDLKEADVRIANLRSLQSGQPAELAFGFANDSVAVGLVFGFKAAQPIPYPIAGGAVAASLWQLAQSAYEQQKAECSGTGDKRMAIILRYMSRAALAADVERGLQAEAAEQQAIADKL